MRCEFQVHILNEQGIDRARQLGDAFSKFLDKLEALVPAGRERAIALLPENQKETT